MTSEGKAYYYDDQGHVSHLEPSGRVAVDTEAAEDHGVGAELLEQWRSKGIEARHSIVVIDENLIPSKLRTSLDEKGISLPVFSAEGALIVVLPEVRVEAADEETAKRVTDLVEDPSSHSEVVSKSKTRLTVRPSSGRGSDALALANRIEETVHPKHAQARFVRLVPRPNH